MSWIWTVMLSFSDEESWDEEEDEDGDGTNCEALNGINAWLEADKVRRYGPLTELTISAGENDMSANLYGGGFKHFDIEGFLQIVKQQKWRDPDNLQIFIKGEEDQKFTVLTIQDL